GAVLITCELPNVSRFNLDIIAIMTREGIAPGEWLHCYNRGVDKRRVFETKADYERFLLLMYLSKYESPAHVANFRDWSFHEILQHAGSDFGSQIVELGAYSLMPNHLHFV